MYFIFIQIAKLYIIKNKENSFNFKKYSKYNPFYKRLKVIEKFIQL